tara:strand:+ start:356 stop:1060 length:705 start_codon:yes stop_codon:yes gene_type:complete
MTQNTFAYNWSKNSFFEGPNYKCIWGDPVCDFGGGSIWRQIFEQNDQTSYFGLSKAGQLNIFNDDTLTLTGGNTKKGGACVNIIGTNGDVNITADKNGVVRIKGAKKIVYDSPDMFFNCGRHIHFKANSIQLECNSLNTTAYKGNLKVRDVSFAGLCYKNLPVGENALNNLKSDLLSATEGLQTKDLASKANNLMKNIDTDAIGGELKGLGDKFQQNLNNNNFKDALSNFGGFA